MTNNHNNPANRHAFLNWFIENPVTTNLLMISILVIGCYMVGFFGLFEQTAKLKLEAFPSVPPNTVTISASISGSTPEDVERGVTTKLEEAIKSVQGIEKMTSTSTSSVAGITVTAETGYDLETLHSDIQTQVDSVNNLPSQVDKVLVSKQEIDEEIIWVSLYGDTSEKELKTTTRKLENKLLRDQYIDKVEITGDRDYEISIEVSESNLRRYGLTFGEVSTAISNSSLDLSAGTLDSNQGEITLRIKSQAYNKADYENIIVRSTPAGGTIRVKDIADVRDDFIDENILSLFNGKNSMTLMIFAQGDANVLASVESAKRISHEFAATLPDNIELSLWRDRTVSVNDRIDLFKRNGMMGMFLVFLLLTLFLNIKLAFWVAAGIPISFCGALILMGVKGISISLISLFGFILVLGIIVDDAIVIGESIYTQKKQDNNAPDATIRGVGRVSTAATFGVLTTIAAFLPLTQVEGEMGQIIGQMAYVVVFCLIFSLVESKLILPSHLHHIRVTAQGEAKNSWQKLQSAISHGLERFIEKIYQPLLMLALRYRYFSLLAFISVFVFSLGLVLSGTIKQVFFPRIEPRSISLSVEMEPTISVETTMAYARKAAEDLRTADKLLMEELNLSDPIITQITAYNQSDTEFKVRASLASAKTRTTAAPVISNKWREIVGNIDGAKSVNFKASQRFSIADIEVEINSNNLDDMIAVSTAIQDKFNAFNGVKDVSTNLDSGSPEILIHLKPQAQIYGISKSQLANEIRGAFYGVEAQRVQRSKDEVKVMVRYPENQRKSLSDLYNLKIRANSGQAIAISSIADLEFSTGYAYIKHINGQQAITVYANVDKSLTSSEQVLTELDQSFFPILTEKYDVNITLGGEADEGEKSKSSMLKGFLISLALIYILLAIPLKSYSKPFIIMSVIPFGIIGAILGHWLLGMSISMLSLFGILALSGVVVNDSLVFVSSIQLYRSEGYSHNDAIRRTGVRRFRPIILTSLTTFTGLMPILLETSFQAQFLIPMAVSLGFGILFATLLTLFLIPIVYYIMGDIKKVFMYEGSEQLS